MSAHITQSVIAKRPEKQFGVIMRSQGFLHYPVELLSMGRKISEKYARGTWSIMSMKRHRKKCTLGLEAYVPHPKGSGVASGIVLCSVVMEENSPDTMSLPMSPCATRTYYSPSVTRMPQTGVKCHSSRLPTLRKKDSKEPSACFVSILAVRVQ